MKQSLFTRAGFAFLLFVACGILPAQAPPLPAGLDSSGGAPPLPAGLDSSGGAPALPEGLGGDAASTPSSPKDGGAGAVLPVYGFWDTRAGIRTGGDPAQSKDAILGETRLQLGTDKAWERVSFDVTADVILDAIEEEPDFDLRQLRLTWTPLNNLDIRIGRQILTWGTGDMLFINDLFPKDWNSFFIGRDTEYLKAPSDAVRLGWFHDWLNVELVYTPKFNPDRYITGERISYYSALQGGSAGASDTLHTEEPGRWFDNDEWALRLSRNIGAAELSLYGYYGYWKSPGGMQLYPSAGIFPSLRVYGASLRGSVGKGVANIEAGYYDSVDDRGGDDVFRNNSEYRLLLGYERELAREFTGAAQYYLEHMTDYDDYRHALWFFMPKRDEDRHVLTMRFTKLLMNQNMTLSLFGYWSPSDSDAYLRPNIAYKLNDRWKVELGGNIFLGNDMTTFFGQFQDNTNVYMGIRCSF